MRASEVEAGRQSPLGQIYPLPFGSPERRLLRLYKNHLYRDYTGLLNEDS